MLYKPLISVNLLANHSGLLNKYLILMSILTDSKVWWVWHSACGYGTNMSSRA